MDFVHVRHHPFIRHTGNACALKGEKYGSWSENCLFCIASIQFDPHLHKVAGSLAVGACTHVGHGAVLELNVVDGDVAQNAEAASSVD
jgi:hypothetical protein